jgi:hypothetical protein
VGLASGRLVSTPNWSGRGMATWVMASVKKRFSVGRSGDIMANQPKAAGSSLILQLTKYLTVSAMHHMNYEFVEDVLLLPLATGMALTMALLTLKEQKPNVHHALA